MKKALVTGISGQDGSYLTELLLSKGYEVHGIIRRSSTFNTGKIDHIFDKLNLHYGDVSDSESISHIIQNEKPDEIYHLAAQSHVQVSFNIPEYTSNVTGIGTLRILEAIRRSNRDIKFYQASSSELFGSSPAPQNETTQFKPQSPYAVSKLMAYWNTVNYRDGYNMFASNGILFNHESPRRGETFVTRKITLGLSRILSGKQTTIQLGNLNAKRDWGLAAEYVKAMWLILQQDKPHDYVIGTGESHTIKQFIEECLNYIGLEYYNNDIGEYFIKNKNEWNLPIGQKIITRNSKYYRPTEVNHLEANITKMKNVLKWEPKVKFKELVSIMMDFDMMKENLVPIGGSIEIVLTPEFNFTTMR